MAPKVDIRSWKVFKPLDSTFIADIRMAMVVGHGEAGIIVTRNDDVFSIGSSDELLGVKGKSKTKVPLKIKELSGIKIKGIYSGYWFVVVVVLTESGQLFVWGDINYGRLGLGEDTPARIPTPLPMPNGELVRDVACGNGHTVTLTVSGKVYSWGHNDAGQVSKRLSDSVWTPVDALTEDGLGRSKVISVACGTSSSFALRSNGQVWIWGRDMSTEDYRIIEPTMIPLSVQVTKIVCGDWNALMLDKEGGIFGAPTVTLRSL